MKKMIEERKRNEMRLNERRDRREEKRRGEEK